MCMIKNGKYNKHTKNFAKRLHFVRKGENWNMHKIDWFEGGLKVIYIATKNVGEHDLTPGIKYIMLRLDN